MFALHRANAVTYPVVSIHSYMLVCPCCWIDRDEFITKLVINDVTCFNSLTALVLASGSRLPVVLNPLNTPTHSCVSGLERADRQGVCRLGCDSIHERLGFGKPVCVTGRLVEGQPDLQTFSLPVLSPPETLQELSEAQRGGL